MAPLLTVQDLRVAYPAREGGWTEVVRGVSFTLGRERLGIVGESGSGKSQTGRAILGLTAPGGRVTAQTLQFSGIDLLHCPAQQRRALRGGRIAMVLQDPKYSLDPVMRIGAQIEEALQAHKPCTRAQARLQVHDALAAVGIEDPARLSRLYPHEVSGGMGQRAMIAMMLIAGPELLIADEPTTALRRDTCRCSASQSTAALPTKRFDLHQARHPSTRGLLNCLPQLGAPRHPLPTLDRKPEWKE